MIKLDIEPTTFRCLLGVIPFALKGGYTSAVNGVCLEGDTNQITAYATDRYKLARVTIPVEEEIGHFRVLVDAQALAAAVKAVAPLRACGGMVTIEVSDEVVRIAGNNQTHELRTMEGDYPPVHKFFQQGHGNVEEILLAPAALKALADSAQALGAKTSSIQLKFTAPNKPVIATMPLDDNVTFEAVIMPVHRR